MRTPNAQCLLCEKPLYRRPGAAARARYAACMDCRSKAQSVVGVTPSQRDRLNLGSVKGTNHRTGYKHRAESKDQIKAANKAFWSANPEKAVARGALMRAENHYKWNGGTSQLNKSIRQMDENRKWMDAVKERDGRCMECGSTDELESHHVKHLAELIAEFGITSRDEARAHADRLWDVSNGKTLCKPCHYAEHGRALCANL